MDHQLLQRLSPLPVFLAGGEHHLGGAVDMHSLGHHRLAVDVGLEGVVACRQIIALQQTVGIGEAHVGGLHTLGSGDRCGGNENLDLFCVYFVFVHGVELYMVHIVGAIVKTKFVVVQRPVEIEQLVYPAHKCFFQFQRFHFQELDFQNQLEHQRYIAIHTVFAGMVDGAAGLVLIIQLFFQCARDRKANGVFQLCFGDLVRNHGHTWIQSNAKEHGTLEFQRGFDLWLGAQILSCEVAAAPMLCGGTKGKACLERQCGAGAEREFECRLQMGIHTGSQGNVNSTHIQSIAHHGQSATDRAAQLHTGLNGEFHILPFGGDIEGQTGFKIKAECDFCLKIAGDMTAELSFQFIFIEGKGECLFSGDGSFPCVWGNGSAVKGLGSVTVLVNQTIGHLCGVQFCVFGIAFIFQLHEGKHFIKLHIRAGDGDIGTLHGKGANLEDEQFAFQIGVNHYSAGSYTKQIVSGIGKAIDQRLIIGRNKGICCSRFLDDQRIIRIDSEIGVFVFVQLIYPIFPVLLHTVLHRHGKQFLHVLGIKR